ncbi:hypothetical protein KCP75_11505 [Salmonella enterica subsp. enterica]|nr:hypothetical protein KCP75_11505 [Salmonella enterica subsp. enterica]
MIHRPGTPAQRINVLYRSYRCDDHVDATLVTCQHASERIFTGPDIFTVPRRHNWVRRQTAVRAGNHDAAMTCTNNNGSHIASYDLHGEKIKDQKPQRSVRCRSAKQKRTRLIAN